MKNIIAGATAAFALCGCWTFSTTDYPKVATMAAQGDASKLMLAINGFDAAVTEYDTVHGYTTVYVPGCYGWYHYRPGFYDIMPTYSIIPTRRATDVFRKRAQEQFEDAGFSIATAPTVPDYTVDVDFSGPSSTSDDVWASFGWKICTLFFCDYEGAEWMAKLRIRDNRTGKIVFTHEYSQRYETHVFGLVPLFSIASCDETGAPYIQGWCLSALTDRAVADASAFFAAQPPAAK